MEQKKYVGARPMLLLCKIQISDSLYSNHTKKTRYIHKFTIKLSFFNLFSNTFDRSNTCIIGSYLID